MLVDQLQQTLIELHKGGERKFHPSFGNSLGAGQAKQIGVLGQMREKGVEFILNAGLEAGDHGNQQDRKGQGALALEAGVNESCLIEKFARMQVFRELDKNGMVLRSSWKTTFNIN